MGLRMTCAISFYYVNTFTDRRFHTESFFHAHTQTHFHTKTFEIQNKLFEIQKKLGTMMPWMTLVANKGGQT